jgi:hypothetical protein
MRSGRSIQGRSQDVMASAAPASLRAGIRRFRRPVHGASVVAWKTLSLPIIGCSGECLRRGEKTIDFCRPAPTSAARCRCLASIEGNGRPLKKREDQNQSEKQAQPPGRTVDAARNRHAFTARKHGGCCRPVAPPPARHAGAGDCSLLPGRAAGGRRRAADSRCARNWAGTLRARRSPESGEERSAPHATPDVQCPGPAVVEWRHVCSPPGPSGR